MALPVSRGRLQEDAILKHAGLDFFNHSYKLQVAYFSTFAQNASFKER
jgi:hypothetical protein